MLNENIKALRKSKGLSQEELAAKLNVVRQTVSKWENGLSVPDADMLIRLSEELDAPVSTLLGDAVCEKPAEDLKVIAEKLEVINRQLSRRKTAGIKILRRVFILLIVGILAAAAFFIGLNGSYLNYDLSDPEISVVATFLHGFEWRFSRLAPFALAGAVAGLLLTQDRA